MTLDAIRNHDPAFDQTAFLARAEAVLALVLRARSEGRPEQARAVVSQDMAMRLSAELDGQRTAGRRQVHEGVRVRSCEVVEAGGDGRWDTIAVRFTLEGASYEADTAGKPLPGANRAKRSWSEVWWFQRKADATTGPTPEGPLDRCPGCGAPVSPTADGACTYCHRTLASPRSWVLTRMTEANPTREEVLSTFTVEATGAARSAGRIIALTFALLVVGATVAGVVFATQATKSVREAFTPPEITLPSGVTLPAGVTLPRGPGQTTSTGFVTPVANPRVQAPVNDVTTAAAAVLAKVGRPLLASSIHLYTDGRIIFELQAADDPRGVDNWVWKAGTVTGPDQGLIGVDPARVYPVAGLDLTNLARLCDTAIGATGIADGTVDSPYLLKIGTGLRWYIPVKSTSRASTQRTYRVAPDGTKPEVF